jgi:drug/metabolite transporter (DMT)-like permease
METIDSTPPRTSTSIHWKVLLGLVLCNLIWSAHPLMGKWLLEDFSPTEGAWLRYMSALMAFWILRPLLPRGDERQRSLQISWKSYKELALAIFLGLMAFCFSPLLQLTGLHASRATDNALIVAMEPLFTVAAAWLFLRQALSLGVSLCFLLALIGFFFLAGVPLQGLGGFSELGREHFIGNVVMLVSLIGEAIYSVAGSKLMSRGLSPVSVYAWANFSGVIGLTVAVAVLTGESPVQIIGGLVHHMHWKSAVGLLWLGPLGTTATYLYWMGALRGATVASLALTLFIQPIFGTIWGYVFLDERLTVLQTVGGVLIIAAVFAQSFVGASVITKK